jgi:hypothetical protein
MGDIASPLDLARQGIATAKTAIDEGEAILQRTQERYRLKPHSTEPERPRLPKPKLISEPELPDYVLTAADHVNVAAVMAMMKMADAAQSEGLRKAAYRDLDLHLQELRQNRDQAELATILRHECGLTLRSAYQLVATAIRTKRLEQSGFEHRARDGKRRAILRDSVPTQKKERAYG